MRVDPVLLDDQHNVTGNYAGTSVERSELQRPPHEAAGIERGPAFAIMKDAEKFVRRFAPAV
jgi:hypothetical protein